MSAAIVAISEESLMSEAHIALVVALVALLLLAAYRRVGAHDTRAPSLSIRARQRNSELAFDVVARGWPAIVTVAVLAAIAAVCVFIR